ncbi:MAG: hypothetical protein QNJ91_02390 [Gammaproteobacteria bacterium]|nr:hypothetical protein [Gammaproteobacteria bacterium]
MPDKSDTSRLQGLDEYLVLFQPYEQQLKDFAGREREYGGRFALLFRQVVRLLTRDLPVNDLMPRMYRNMALLYLDRDKDTVRHFSYEDNRHFFLSELREWLAVRERGRVIREMSQAGPV